MSVFIPVRWDDEAAWLLGLERRDEAALAPLDGERRHPVGGWTDKQIKKTRTDGRTASERFALTSSSDVCRHFGGLLRLFCQCISFSWFVCVPSFSCVYRAWPQGAGMCVSFPKGDRLSVACRVTECSICVDPAKQSKHTGRQLLETTLQAWHPVWRTKSMFEYRADAADVLH